MFPSLKGFDFGLDTDKGTLVMRPREKFPSLKGFDFGLDRHICHRSISAGLGFHPSKGSTSA